MTVSDPRISIKTAYNRTGCAMKKTSKLLPRKRGANKFNGNFTQAFLLYKIYDTSGIPRNLLSPQATPLYHAHTLFSPQKSSSTRNVAKRLHRERKLEVKVIGERRQKEIFPSLVRFLCSIDFLMGILERNRSTTVKGCDVLRSSNRQSNRFFSLVYWIRRDDEKPHSRCRRTKQMFFASLQSNADIIRSVIFTLFRRHSHSPRYFMNSADGKQTRFE